MHCSDLERYLEACLDGQLGESRRRSLQDHLRLCRGCAERVDGLRRFEADLQRRLRAMQHEASLWQPLGLETVHGGPAPSALPIPAAPLDAPTPARLRHRHRLRVATLAAAPEPKPRRRLQSLAGVALLAAALGALADMALGGFGWLQGDKRTAVYRAYLDGAAELDLVTEEPAQLEAWFATKLGAPVDLPTPPAAFDLVGGTTGDVGLAAETGLAVYRSAAGPVLLLIENALGRTVAVEPGPMVEDGLTRRDWQSGPYAYSLISPLPPDKLAEFPVD
jgi:anti-sigma factor RsiW